MRSNIYRIDDLTSFRFFAATWVIFHHYMLYLPGEAHDFGHLLHAGSLGVDFFFILSGYVLTHVYGSSFRSVWQFWRKRLAKIYPMHLLTLSFYVLLVVAVGLAGVKFDDPTKYDSSQILPNLLMIQAWGPSERGSFNYPSWSVSAEWFAYLLFPLMTFAIHRINAGWSFIAASILFIVAYLAAPAILGKDFISLANYFGVYRIVPEFLVGMALCRVVNSVPMPAFQWSVLSYALIAVIVALSFIGSDPIVVITAIAALIYTSGMRAKLDQATILEWPPLKFLGEISFSMYMVHAPVATLWFWISPRLLGPTSWLHIFIGYGIVVVCSVLTYSLFEEPLRKWLGGGRDLRLGNLAS